MTLDVQTTTDAHAGDYYLKIKVHIDAFGMSHTNIDELFVRINQSCKYDSFLLTYWTGAGTKIGPMDHTPTQDTNAFTWLPVSVTNSFAGWCTPFFTFTKLQTTPTTSYQPYSGSDVIFDLATRTVTLASTAA